jgi:hypothetical protein
MCVLGVSESQGALKKQLAGRTGQQIGAANDVTNTLVCVVHDDGQLIGEEPVAAFDDEVAALRLHVAGERSLNPILKLDRTGGHAKPDGARRAGILDARSAPAGVAGLLAGFDGARGCGYGFPAAGAGVHEPLLPKSFQRLFVAIGALALADDGPGPFEAEGLEGSQDAICASWDFASPIDVFDTYEPFAALGVRIEIAGDGGDEGAEVQIAGGRGCESTAVAAGIGWLWAVATQEEIAGGARRADGQER